MNDEENYLLMSAIKDLKNIDINNVAKEVYSEEQIKYYTIGSFKIPELIISKEPLNSLIARWEVAVGSFCQIIIVLFMIPYPVY